MREDSSNGMIAGVCVKNERGIWQWTPFLLFASYETPPCGSNCLGIIKHYCNYQETCLTSFLVVHPLSFQ